MRSKIAGKKSKISRVSTKVFALNDAIKHITRIKDVKKRNKIISQCTDQLIRDLSPKIRKSLKYLSPLLSAKGNRSLKKFCNNTTPIHVRRKMIKGQSGGGVGSWFTSLIGSIIPILGAIL